MDRAVTPTLARLARHNLAAGCIEETWGALVAMHQAIHARDSRVQRVMAAIAPDEARHAELAWAIHRWAGVRMDRARPVARLRRHIHPDTALGLPGPRLFDRLVAALPA